MAINKAKLMATKRSWVEIDRRCRLVWKLAWAFCLVLLSQRGWGQELPVVSYRFIEDPVTAPRQDQPYLPIPDANLAMLQSSLMRERLFAIQVVAARANAGLSIPAEVMTALPEMAKSATTDDFRRAMVSAAVALKSKEMIEGLREFVDSDALSSIELERRAAELDKDHWLDVWRKRLGDEKTHEPALVRAIEGLGEFGNADDAQAIQRKLESDSRPNVATAACRAMGKLTNQGLESLSRNRTAQDPSQTSPERCIQAISLVRNHTSQEAKKLFEIYAGQFENAGVQEALKSLYACDQESAVTIARKRVNDKDPIVRAACIETLVAANKDEDLPLLIHALRDPIKSNRQLSAQKLVQVAHASAEKVVPLLEEELKSESWQSIEQSTLILTSIGRKEMIPRQLELLDHARPEVFVTSAWSLRKLVTEEKHLETIVDKLKTLLDWLGDDKSKKPKTQDHSHLLAHLIEATGEQRYLPATEHLMRLVPKDARFALHARACAVWAIGRIHEGMPDSPALQPMEDRMTDFLGQQPEKIWVRFAAAIAVGRIGNPKSIPKIQSVPDTELSPPGLGKFWALRKFGVEK